MPLIQIGTGMKSVLSCTEQDPFMLSDTEAQHAYESEVEAFASAFAREVTRRR